MSTIRKYTALRHTLRGVILKHAPEIECVSAAIEADWALAIQLGAKGYFELTTFKYSCSVVYSNSGGSPEQCSVPLTSTVFRRSTHTTLDEFVRRALELPGVVEILREGAEKQFWFQYTEPGGIGELNVQGSSVHVSEIRVDLNVERRMTPVEFSTGKYRGVPFLSGTSTGDLRELHFVLLKTTNGVSGHALVDGSGLK